jgi:VWFA-related protein
MRFRSALPIVAALVTSATVSAQDAPAPVEAKGRENASVEVRQIDKDRFPDIAVDFELKRPDGTAILDAKRDEFLVKEDGQEVQILDYTSPVSREFRTTTVVLVLDHSLSMRNENRMRCLKRAVNAFLDQQPAGSRVAVVAFGSEVELLCDFTDDYRKVREAVDELSPFGATRFYDAVVEALKLIGEESGRRAVVAMTDGEDTASIEADLEKAIEVAKAEGLPVHAVGVGSEEEIKDEDLRDLADGSRGRYFPARDAAQLRSIYEEIARSLKQSYSLTYRTNNAVQDGTLRPIEVVYRANPKGVGKSDVYIPGMVVPKVGWSPLFLGLVLGLVALGSLPAVLRKRPA